MIPETIRKNPRACRFWDKMIEKCWGSNTKYLEAKEKITEAINQWKPTREVLVLKKGMTKDPHEGGLGS